MGINSLQMSKKKKHNLQHLIAKRRQLQQVVQGAVIAYDQPAENIEPFHQRETAVVTAKINRPIIKSDRALKKTAVSIVFITVLLVGAVIFDQKSPYLNQFGDWIYSALRLQS